MELLIAAILWYAFGFYMYAHTLWTIDQNLTVRDLLVSSIAGFFGVFAILWYFAYAEKEWLDKKIF